MTDIFEKNYALLITNVAVNGKPVDIFIDATGIIGGIGENERKKHKGEAEFIIDGDGAIALPGLVNTHTHAAMTLLRGYADDMVLQDWLSQKIWPLEAHLKGEAAAIHRSYQALPTSYLQPVNFPDMGSLYFP
jgi:5-methylthioadenosine/S-adenosylhomocysteine deaminase